MTADQAELQAGVDEALKGLSLIEERVLRMLHGLGEPAIPKEEVARRLFHEIESIEIIEARALRKLKHPAIAGRLSAAIERAGDAA